MRFEYMTKNGKTIEREYNQYSDQKIGREKKGKEPKQKRKSTGQKEKAT